MNVFIPPLFIDIETVGIAPDFASLPASLQSFWEKKARHLGAETSTEAADLFAQKAAIFAEFGKVIVIAMGYIKKGDQGKASLHIKGLANDDEKVLLSEFTHLLQQFPVHQLQLCGHHAKEFDFPYLARRMMINGLPIPSILNTSGKKPWEVNHIDTMDLWKFGDYKQFIALDLLAHLFHIPSSKDDIDGSQVHHVYYQKGELERIKTYCMKDVVVTAQVYRKMIGLPLITPEHISWAHS